MPLKCYTCGEQIIFDDSVVSKTGKKIPLWPDGQNTHGHDDDGNPIRGDLPNVPKQQQQERKVPQINTYKREPGTPADIPKHSQGGPSLDTKRILQTLVELTKQNQEIKGLIDNAVIIDSARYENQMSILYDQLSNKTKEQMFKSASEITDTATVNHSKIADDAQNFLQSKKDMIRKNTKFVDESRDKPSLDERIPDSAEDYPIEQTLKDDEDEGVIAED